MIAQLDLFRLQRPLPTIDPLLDAVPMAVDRNSSYQSFNGAIARNIILKLCRDTNNWINSRAITRACKMRPQDLGLLCSNMVRRGELEKINLYYGSSTPGEQPEKNYCGFQYGYRLIKAVAA